MNDYDEQKITSEYNKRLHSELDVRIAVCENRIKHLVESVKELKYDVVDLRNEMRAEFKEMKSFVTKILIAGLTILGLIFIIWSI